LQHGNILPFLFWLLWILLVAVYAVRLDRLSLMGCLADLSVVVFGAAFPVLIFDL